METHICTILELVQSFNSNLLMLIVVKRMALVILLIYKIGEPTPKGIGSCCFFILSKNLTQQNPLKANLVIDTGYFK